MAPRPTIVADEDAFTVSVDGLLIRGWVIDRPCERCDEKLIYDDHYDAELCAFCNEWDSEACDDPKCGFCPSRPKRPLWRKRME